MTRAKQPQKYFSGTSFDSPEPLPAPPAMPEWLAPNLHWLTEAGAKTFDLTPYSIIRPTLGRIVLRMLSTGDVTAAGIVLPSGPQESTSIGVVERVCDSYRSAEDDEDRAANGPLFIPGQVVAINKYSGTELTINRQKRVICYESDILCTLDRSDDATP